MSYSFRRRDLNTLLNALLRGALSDALVFFTTVSLYALQGNRRNLLRRAAFRLCGTCSTKLSYART